MQKLIVILSILICTTVNAQELPGSSMYLQNDFILNPAIAGTKSFVPVSVSHRSQWINFSNAPTTQLASVHGGMNGKAGVGLALINHTAGPTGMMSAQFSYSYRVKLTEKLKFSFGLAPMIIQHSVNKNKISLDEQNDNTFNRMSNKTIIADLNTGFYLYSASYYVGVSVLQVAGNKLRSGDDLFKEQLKRHYLLQTGIDRAISEKYIITPSLLVKFIESGAPVQFDVNVKATYNKLFWGGLSYRFSSSTQFNESAIVFVGVAKNNFSFGYSYDYNFGSIGQFSSGSHELFLSYRIPFQLNKEVTEPAK